MRASVAGLLMLLASACAPASGQTGAASPPASQEPRIAGQAALELFPSGYDSAGVVLRNGASVTLAHDISVEVYVDPYPATGSTVWLDLFLARKSQAIDTAQVISNNEMAYMTHGSTRQVGTNSGDGHYVFALSDPMVGPWRHRIDIQDQNQHYDMPLVVTVYPA